MAKPPYDSSGIYVLSLFDYVYVGQSKTINKRFAYHLCRLRCGKHDNSRLQRTVDKYGIENVECLIIETCSAEEDLSQKEQLYVNLFREHGFVVLNLGECVTAPMKGRTLSLETRQKLSKAHLGKIISDEAKAKMSASRKGKPRSEETKARISAAKSGKPGKSRPCSEETKQKLRESNIKTWTLKLKEATDEEAF